MSVLQFDVLNKSSAFKMLNAMNGGPCHRRHRSGQNRSTLKDIQAIRAPYCRNHETNFDGFYGIPYTHCISTIFPNFDADPTDPYSYDFACTDEAIAVYMEGGAKVFYRLGESIEPQVKKYATLPPKDFQKWAIICEHIIRHYTEGWANGFEYDIEYWEIWNEPDRNEDKPELRTTWGGTREQFFDMYEIAAKHLKGCFPHLKIGGPALAGNLQWAENFLSEMEKRTVPIDFFSWHSYCTEPQKMLDNAEKLDGLLKKYHYDKAERILDEWNYLKDGSTDNYIYTFKTIHGIKGAAFAMANMCAAQTSNYIDMLMYYDTQPSEWNGMIDFYTFKRLKGFYPFYWYGMFYDMKHEIKAQNSLENIYSLCGIDENDKILAVVTYYSDVDGLENKKVTLDIGREGTYEIYLLDEEHNGDLVGVTDKLEFDMKLHSAVLIKEIERCDYE